MNCSENAIFCQDVSKKFCIFDEQLNWRIVFRDISDDSLNTFEALKDINLVVPKGKFVGILGRNGAGKSTLLRVLGSVYAPTKGIVNTTGQVSCLFEMGGLGNNRLTGYSYADRFLQLYGVSEKQERKKLIENIRDFSELGSDLDRPLYTYSSGMLARLYFSVATEMQYEIYLVDELLSVGDEHFQAKCWKRLRHRFSNGASGILVTHDWPAVLKLCEVSYILEKGRISSFGPSNITVQTYLNLSLPSKEYAEIILRPEGYVFEAGKDCDIAFDVLVNKQIPIAISYSIDVFRSVDIFREGTNWELLLLNDDFVPLDFKLGLNHVAIKIKSLPLVPGEYCLNLFIRSVKNKEYDNSKLDIKSWTYGNGIPLTVLGAKGAGIVELPWCKTIETVTYD